MTTESNNVSESSVEEPQKSSHPSSGQQLQAAREAAGLSIKDVATRLNLRQQVVVDIENDNSDHHISATFFKGYIRSYAKLLGIPEQSILASYESSHDPIQPAKMHTFSSQRIHERHNDHRLKWWTILIVLVLLVSLGFWGWQNHSIRDFLPESMGSHEGAVELSTPESAAADVDNVQPETSAKAVKTEPAPAPATMPSPPADAAQVALNTAAKLEDNGVAATAKTEHHFSSVTSDVEVTDNGANTTKAADLAGEAEAHTPLHQLHLSFSKACWIEVRDAAGNRLTTGVKQAGQDLELNGQPPYKVIIGVPDAVTISYGGTPVSFNTSSANGRTARLTIPKS